MLRGVQLRFGVLQGLKALDSQTEILVRGHVVVKAQPFLGRQLAGLLVFERLHFLGGVEGSGPLLFQLKNLCVHLRTLLPQEGDFGECTRAQTSAYVG